MSTLKPLPVSGTKIQITGGIYRGTSAVVDCYKQGRLYAMRDTGKGWILIGPIDPAHVKEV